MGKRLSVDDRLSAIRHLRDQQPSPQVTAELRSALGDKSNLIIAAAAAIAGDQKLAELSPDLEAASHDHAGSEQSALTAPMPGTVLRVLAREGDTVKPRQPLVVLEAMKMETPVVSPYEAVVRAVHVTEGDRVAGGELLVELEE